MIDGSLSQRLQVVAGSGRFPPALIERFAKWIQEGPEDELFRVSLVRWAERHGVDGDLSLDLFLHATHAGIFDLGWGVTCPVCGSLLSTPGALRALQREEHCKLCRIPVPGTLDDRVEVTFTVCPAARPIRLHDASRLTLREDMERLFFSPSTRATPFREWRRRAIFADAVIPPEATGELELEVPEGPLAVFAPGVHAVGRLEAAEGNPREVSLDVVEGELIPPEAKIGVGRCRLRLRNLTRYPAPVGMMTMRTDCEVKPERELDRFLTGKRVLTSQTFRELFRGSTIPGQGGLELKHLSILFTDLKASTAMYERVGDFAALELVRRHFDVLREVIGAERGAIVKTIGDAVMAVFGEPDRAMSAALRMNGELVRLSRGGEDLVLKVGLHAGSCVAIESNNQLDYFGRTVNIAARVQNVADAGEVVCTEAVWETSGVRELAARTGRTARGESVHLKGIADDVRVFRLQA